MGDRDVVVDCEECQDGRTPISGNQGQDGKLADGRRYEICTKCGGRVRMPRSEKAANESRGTIHLVNPQPKEGERNERTKLHGNVESPVGKK